MIVMNRIRLSKTLSYILRHHPEDFGLQLNPNGTVEIKEMVKALNRKFKNITKEDLEKVVRKDKKGRFSLLDNKTKIRANYGHSIKGIDLNYEPVTPPEILFHGTARKFKAPILKQGLKPMNRNFTHLSKNYTEAIKTGKRRDPKPIIFKIKAKLMYDNGYEFYKTGKEIYLTKTVPVKFIEIDEQHNNDNSEKT